ncbi:MAG: hypothetical protein IH943_10605 [Acidobacteria bacterium]|nr:hypothetical protein [Acidobacteriota bacterium]
MPPEADWGKTGLDGFLDFKDDQLVVTLLSHAQQTVTTYDVTDLRFISYQSADIRFRTGSLITVGFSDGEVQFLIREPVHNIREHLDNAARDCPSLPPLLQEGPPPTTTRPF